MLIVAVAAERGYTVNDGKLRIHVTPRYSFGAVRDVTRLMWRQPKVESASQSQSEREWFTSRVQYRRRNTTEQPDSPAPGWKTARLMRDFVIELKYNSL
jgi:hypothetical protein